MEIRLRPETEARLRDLETTSGRSAGELVEDAMAAYLAEAAQLRSTLDTRYDEIKTGRVKPIDGEQALAKLRERSKKRRRSRS